MPTYLFQFSLTLIRVTDHENVSSKFSLICCQNLAVEALTIVSN